LRGFAGLAAGAGLCGMTEAMTAFASATAEAANVARVVVARAGGGAGATATTIGAGCTGAAATTTGAAGCDGVAAA